MRITFRRLPSGVDSYSEIERDDGAVFRMAEFTRGGARLPHDLRHLVVELELGVTDGIWGTNSSGGTSRSCRSPAAQQVLATVPARPRREGGKGSGKARDRHGQRRRGT